MSQLELDAFNIVKGEMNGDKYEWDAEWHDSTGKPHTGAWRSFLDDKGKASS
jgi:hypothetical protein